MGVYVAQGDAVADPACPSINREASQLVGAGDREAGAALPLQQTSRVEYRAAVKHSAETQLQGLRLMAANRGCFSGNELDGLDLRIEHLDNLVRKYSQPV